MKKKLLTLFLSESFRSAGISLLSFFSSVYIFKQILAMTGDAKLSFLAVFAFYLLLHVWRILGSCLAENLALKFGLKRQMLAGHFLTVLTLLAFAFVRNNFWFLWLAASFWGLAIGFFWFGRHGLLVKMGQKGRFGRIIGWAGILNTVLLLGIPFLGGFLITVFGYQVLFGAAILFVFLGFLTLLPLGEQKTHQDTHFSEVLRLFLTHKRMLLTYASLGAVGTFYGSALLLHIFLVVKKELLFGGFFSLSMVLVALVNLAVGRWTDKRGKKALVAYGSVISSLVWLGRFLTISVGALFIFDAADRISGGMRGIPLAVLSFQKALDGRSTGRALLFREISLSLGSIGACLFLMFVVGLGGSLQTSFLAAAGLSLWPFLIFKKGGLYGETF